MAGATHAWSRGGARYPSPELAPPYSSTPTTTELRVTRTLLLSLLSGLALSHARAGEPVALFDGKDMARWYTFLRDHGRDKDPNGTFSVKDGVLRVSGQDWGGLTTRDEYANYRVEVEYAWGGKVWPPREKNARDSGLILHATELTPDKRPSVGLECSSPGVHPPE
jgi:hypothetical protein